MAKKRFTDIEIWDKEWYMELTPTHKCLMKYIFDKCDASGCWKPNWKLASLHINDNVTEIDLKSLPSDQYEVLENGKIFIPDFIPFQYVTLSDKSPAHNPVFSAISKNNLSNRVFNRVSNTLQEKDKDKEKEKDKELSKINPENQTKHQQTNIIGEMLKVWVKYNPNYQTDEVNDSHALLQIANRIAKLKNIDKRDILNGKLTMCVESWETIVKFIRQDDFYKKLELQTIEKKWTGLFQTMEAAKEGSFKEKQKDPTKVKIILS